MKDNQAKKTAAVEKTGTARKTAGKKTETQTYIYIGPPVRGAANTGDVFTGTRADALKAFEALTARHPGAERLIVKATEAVAARAQIRNKTGVYYHAYMSFYK